MMFVAVVLVIAVVCSSIYAFARLKKAKSHIPVGWKVVEDGVPSLLRVNTLKPVCVTDNGSYIKGDEMRERAIALHAIRSFADCERMFAEQKEISVKFRDFYILFPDAVICDTDGVDHIRYLVCINGIWHREFIPLDSSFGDFACFACAE